MREKSEKSVRESNFLPVKKTEKKAQNGFHAHFWFSREKKKTLVKVEQLFDIPSDKRKNCSKMKLNVDLNP